jgi:hypothetical protein
MPVDPKAASKWSLSQWTTQVKHIRPSDGGAVGVLFVFTHTVNGWPIPQADLVVKPLAGSAAGSKFAERTLSKIAGARGLQSEGIRRSSPLGDAIVNEIDHVIDYHNRGIQSHAQVDRLRQVRDQYASAESFLFQSLAQGMKELDTAYKSDGGLSAMLTNKALVKNMGRLFVADALLGNGDRIDQLNAGNIAFGDDGRLFAVDSGTILTSFEKVVKDASQASWTNSMVQTQNGDRSKAAPSWSWANSVLGHKKEGGVAVPNQAQQQALALEQSGGPASGVVLAPSARMKMLFSPNLVWDHFWAEILKKFNEKNQQRTQNQEPLMTMASNNEKAQAKIWFTEGVIDGLHRADSMLGGLAWLQTKYKFHELRKQHGGDPNYSWTNFKLRRLMIRAAKEGKSYDDAQAIAHQYVQRKFGDFEF